MEKWDAYALLAICIVTLLFTLALFSRMYTAIGNILYSIWHGNSLERIEDNSSMSRSRNLLAVLFAILISLAATNLYERIAGTEPGIPDSLTCTAIFTGLLLFYFSKSITFRIMDWVNNTNVFSLINKIYLSYAIFFVLLLLPGFAILYMVDDISLQSCEYYCITAFALAFLMFVQKSYTLLRSKGFSINFWILYLCTLEILPATAVILALEY